MTEILSVKDVIQRMARLTRELRTVQIGIARHVYQREDHDATYTYRAPDSAEVIAEFRAIIDDVRQIMWLYEGTRAKAPAADARHKLLVRATEILTALSLHPPLPKLSPTETEDSFVHRLMQLIECRIETEDA